VKCKAADLIRGGIGFFGKDHAPMKKAAAISDALFVVGAQNLAGIRIDKMDLRAGEAAQGFEFFRILMRIGGAKALNLPAGQRAAKKKSRHAQRVPDKSSNQ
jgi:hypothetical protein